MDFLEELFELGRRKRLKNDGAFHEEDHHDHDDDHHDRRHQYQANTHPQSAAVPAVISTGIICRTCSTQTVQGAKFCHGCGTAIEMVLKCACCGSKLPANVAFCPQCGYGNE